MIPIGLVELKQIELNLLVQFKKYCEKHNLKYFLYAGTLLGAVRHKGFIPWDDDIDVLMPRPDYERFYELTKTEPVCSYAEVHTYRNDPYCICPFIKLQDSRTDGHEAHLLDEFSTGVWIDIFPMDGVPSDKKEKDAHISALQKKLKLLSLCTRPLVFTWDPLRLAKRIAIYLRYHNVSFVDVNRDIETLAMKYDYNQSEEVGVIAFGGGHNNIVKRSVFEKSVDLEFEGMYFAAPHDYDIYLTTFFGDYMKLPPEKERVPKHQYKAWWKDGFGPLEKELSK